VGRAGCTLLLLATLAGAAAAQEVKRTRAEVEALIEKEGKRAPKWFKKTKLRYPKSLDLAWPQPPPPGGWNPSRNVGQFLWSVINENPSRWREGIRFLHHLLKVHKDNPETLKRTMNALGAAYYNLHEDWARAAFWWRKGGNTQTAGIADCYWELGCREMAVEVLEKIGNDYTRHCSIARLWADMGDIDHALKLANRRGGTEGYLAAGDTCRLAGRYDDAVTYYEKVLAQPDGQRDIPRNKNRARASMFAVKLFDDLDLKRVRSGKYKDSSLGYEAPITVEVKVSRGKIRSVVVTQHKEKQFYSALIDTPRSILKKQGVKGVVATTGATITSEAIINATAKALSQGLKKKKTKK
jgi:uncharacterized protein with FMN-binding domain